jgi:hypothetical protein
MMIDPVSSDKQSTDKKPASKRPKRQPYDLPEDATIISVGAPHGAVLSGWGSTRFGPRRKLVIYLKGVDKPLTVEPDRPLLLGRGSSAQGEIDLDQYDALTHGVSRKHAMLRPDAREDQLLLVDMGSTNGTFVNEEQLSPNLPYTVHDGDTIRLGRLVMHVYFK